MKQKWSQISPLIWALFWSPPEDYHLKTPAAEHPTMFLAVWSKFCMKILISAAWKLFTDLKDVEMDGLGQY